MGHSSYREKCNQYKNKRRMLAEDAPIIKKKKTKKKNKRSDHKHIYRPVILTQKSQRTDAILYHTAFVCEKCGRIDNFYFLWNDIENQIKKFKLENPDHLEKELPEGWNVFSNKSIPI